jgi:hypothetical protein
MEIQDELCAACSKVDLFSLFTGPRYFPGDGFDHKVVISLGTLAEVITNTNCPLCRLLRHDLYETGYRNDWIQEDNDFDHSKVKVNVHPIRADYHEEMKYTNRETRDMVATKLEARLQPMDGLSARETYSVFHHRRGNGIQLLSPVVDPARPLLNGYCVTTLSNSLELLQKWMSTCVESHAIGSKGGACSRPYFHDTGTEYGIRVIDVEQRIIVERNPEDIGYAALSYVWGKDPFTAEDAKLQSQQLVETNAVEGSSSTLPPKTPKVVEDAILVCKKLSIPYLWVDRYCIDQTDLIRKGSEIAGMGYRYLYAKITLIAAMGPEAGLLPKAASGPGYMAGIQRVEIVQGRKYITSLPSIRDQFHGSEWINRAWTMQEGELANRCAFFGKYDISFLCGSGQWRESSHSGPYGHDAEIPHIQTDCEGYHLLSRLRWLNEKPWNFEDYDSLISSYTPRQLSFESDKLNAVTGCLNLIAERKNVRFIYGLPAKDFHYALLWKGEYDRPRQSFPSWSWAGWHSLQNSHQIYPLESGACSLEDDGNGNLTTIKPLCEDTELQGLYITLTEHPHRSNKCSQRFANITLRSYKSNSQIVINSEVAHFSFDILPCPPEPRTESRSSRWMKIPPDFDSTMTSSTYGSWDSTSEYRTPFDRLHLRDDYGNVHIHHYPRWYDHWPPFKLNLPMTLRGETLAWVLKEGIELVMILELKLLDGDESLEKFHLVLCLGIDRREDVAKRCGMFCLPKQTWDKACPKKGIITLG